MIAPDAFRSPGPVRNWAWRGADAVVDSATLWEADVPPSLTGQYAFHMERDGSHLLLRDALGVNKLFYSIDSNGRVLSSNYLIDLRRQGRPIETIFSVPSGSRLRLCPRTGLHALDKVRALAFGHGSDAEEWAACAGQLRRHLNMVFERIRRSVVSRPVYVTLSGGLDSTVIAALASRTIRGVRAVTFCVGDEAASDGPGTDMHFARLAADALQLPLDEVFIDPSELLSLLDVVLVYGQDWRPFNVHCGLVNAALGAALAQRHPTGARPVVLTGDGMNELMADYSAVDYGGTEHYRLPRLGAGPLRRFLVGGLDSGDREVGIFHHYGIDTLQPYASCADAYARLPGPLLSRPDVKRRLMQQLQLDDIPRAILERPKVRAQVGSSVAVTGTLAALIDRGVDARQLAARFAQLFDIDAASLADLIRGGYYRFESPGEVCAA